MENGQAAPGRDGRTCLARRNSQARTGKDKNVFLSSVENEHDWQPDPVDPYSAESAEHAYPNHTPSSSSTYARMPYHGITSP